MINTYLRLRLERELENVHKLLRERALKEDDFADILKQKAAVYVPIDVGAEWNCTAGLSDPEQHPEWNDYKDYTVEIVLRHKTLPDTYWADIQLKVTYHAGGRQILATPFGILGNAPTHVEYQIMLTALVALQGKVASIDFAAGEVIFSKRDPATIP